MSSSARSVSALPVSSAPELSGPVFPESVLEAVLADATRAPSIHNTQPWRFVVRGDTLEVYADVRRNLAVIDPWGRALLVSVGAALLNLRLSIAARLGREPVVRLLPRSSDPAQLATVRVAGPRPASTDERALFEAIPRRRTSREPFEDRRVPAEVFEQLWSAAHVEGASLALVHDQRVRFVCQLAGDAERQWSSDPAYAAEVEAWTTANPDRRDGVPLRAFGPRDRDGRLHPRDFGAGRHPEARASARFERDPQLAVLATATDRPGDHLRAGQALQRVLLQATAAGLSVGLIHQPVELPDLRRLLRDPLAGPSYPQMVLRLGYAATTTPAVQAPVARRPVTDVMRSTR